MFMESEPSALDAPLSPRVARAAIFVERYLLPWAYVFLAWLHIRAMRTEWLSARLIARMQGHGRAPGTISVVSSQLQLIYANLAKDSLILLMMVFIAAMLAISRPPKKLPEKWVHILLPVAMSYYFLLYGAVGQLPPALKDSLFPANWQLTLSLIGIGISLIGYCISLWALFYLRRSFSVLVSVREVVSSGPYTYVRHPIYLGYIFELCGLLIATGSIAMLFLGLGFLFLLVIRAEFEEESLCEASESYRAYVKQTGFLFPVFRR